MSTSISSLGAEHKIIEKDPTNLNTISNNVSPVPTVKKDILSRAQLGAYVKTKLLPPRGTMIDHTSSGLEFTVLWSLLARLNIKALTLWVPPDEC